MKVAAWKMSPLFFQRPYWMLLPYWKPALKLCDPVTYETDAFAVRRWSSVKKSWRMLVPDWRPVARSLNATRPMPFSSKSRNARSSRWYEKVASISTRSPGVDVQRVVLM